MARERQSEVSFVDLRQRWVHIRLPCHSGLTQIFGSWVGKERADVRSHDHRTCTGTDLYRTTVVDECLRYLSKSIRSVVLFYFYQATDCTAKAFFASLLKQLLAALIDKRLPCPATIREEIEHSFGLANRQPDLGGLVADILVPLLSKFEEVIVVLDGPDVCEEHEQREIWKHLLKMTKQTVSGPRVRIAVSSQDHTNITERLPYTNRLRIDDGINMQDIDIFIDDQVSSCSGNGRLFSDDLLRAEVQQLLKKKANGM